MDPGTDARDVLAGRVIPLRRGFVPLVCRSQKDISENLTIATGLTREKAFFSRHFAYKHMHNRCGAPYLTRVLSHMLFTSIRAHLPALRSQLSLTAQSLEAQLRELGDPVEAAGPKEQGHLLLKLLSRFATNFCDMIEGRVHADAGGDLLIDELFGGARMQEIVRTRFNQWCGEWETLMDTQLKDEEILMALRNSAGPRSTLFIPEQAFASLVRRQVVQLKDLGRRFADEIYDELRRIGEKCEPPQLFRFGELREKAVEVVQAVLRRAFVPTVDMIDRIIDIELSHINTQHPDFIGATRAMALAEERGWLYAAGGGGEGSGDPTSNFMGGEGAGAAGRMGGPHSTAAAAAAAQQHHSVDVAWAMRHLGLQGEQKGKVLSALPRSPQALTQQTQGFPGAVSRHGALAGNNHSSSSSYNNNNDDIRVRFGERVANQVQCSEDVGIWGGVVRALRRVGGPNSPFVGVPRPSPHKHQQGGGGDGRLLSGLPISPLLGGRGKISPFHGGAALAPSMMATAAGGVGGGDNADAAHSNSNNGNDNHHHHKAPSKLGGGGSYVGEALLVVPQRPLPETITPGDLRADEKERQEIVLLRILLNSYLHIVKKNYTDFVPKTVMCMLVNRVKDEIASELVHNLYASITSPNMESLLRGA